MICKYTLLIFLLLPSICLSSISQKSKSVFIEDYNGLNLGGKLINALNYVDDNTIIDCTNLSGQQVIDKQIIVLKRNITLLLGHYEIILSGINPTQLPPGAVICILGDGFKLKGNRKAPTILKMGNNCQASAIGLIQCVKAEIADLILEGNKYNIVAQKDDTWSSGITIISYSEKQPKSSCHILSNLEIRNFVHYGIMMYGNTCSNNVINNCTISGIGNLNDIESTGSGICINKNCSNNKTINTIVEGCKTSGFFFCNAGGTMHSYNNSVENCKIINNGMNGILVIEQANFHSSEEYGTKNLLIKNNMILKNKECGIRIGTYNGVGVIESVLIKDNYIESSGQFGILIQGNKGLLSYTKDIQIIHNRINNSKSKGIFISCNIKSTILKKNTFENNLLDVLDNGLNTSYK